MAFKKSTSVTGFPFALVSAADGSAITTGTPTGYYLLDGGSQGSIAGTPVHEGNGQWSVNLTGAEMNGDIVGLLFTHTSAVPVHFTIKTVTTLVNELNDLAAADLAAAFAAIPAAVWVTSGRELSTPASYKADVSALATAASIAALPAAVLAAVAASFTAIPAAVAAVLASAHGAGSWLTGSGSGASLGTGADLCTMTVKTVGEVPFPDADVWITSDALGATVVAGTRQTDSNGTVQFLLDDGATYYLWAQKDGMKSVMGQYFIATAD